MKRYIGTKIIMAKPMTRGNYNTYRGWEIPKNENPDDKGFFVKYPDGYESWSPESVFEEAYRECDNMTFGLAIEAMKKGYRVARKGWNGKKMCIFLTKGSDVPYANLKEHNQEALVCARSDELPRGKDGFMNVETPIHINSHIDMIAADGSIVIGWLASQTDMLAEDWVFVD